MNSSTQAAMFSSATDEWSTPQDFFDRLDAEFGFVLDVCANAENTKAPHYYTRDFDGLGQAWSAAVGRLAAYEVGRAVWMNPPYGREIGRWVRKAADEAALGATVVCLLPARTDTRWWHDIVLASGAEVRFVRGRLKFGGAKNSAPFPSAVVVFRPKAGTP